MILQARPSLIWRALAFRSELIDLSRARRRRLTRLVTEAPSAIRPVHHGPNPKKRPEHVQHEQADPPRSMDRVLVGVMTRMSDLGRNVVDRDDAVDQHDDHEKQQAKRKVIKEWVFHGAYPSMPILEFPARD